jgi:hypothetical protein
VEAHSTGGGIGVEFYPLLGSWIGNMVGTAASVSWVDPQDNFLITLAGSALAGVGVPAAMIGMTAMSVMDEREFKAVFGWAIFFSPVVGAMIASELWRKPLSTKLHLKPEARRVSVGLVPNPTGGLSAIATLHF